MCDKTKEAETYQQRNRLLSDLGGTTTGYENPMVYQLKQQREFHIKKLVEIQVAIEAVNKITF